MLGSIALTALNAQTLRDAQPPSEFPPASYQGKQFVDSRGCIYIRAGVDGSVTWVPRVARNRKQICGYKPTAVAGTTARPSAPNGGKAPTVITLAPAASQDKTALTAEAPAPEPAPAAKVAAATAPAVQPKPAPAKPVQTAAASAVPSGGGTPSQAPKPTVFRNPAPTSAPVAATTTTRTAAAQPSTTHVPSPGPKPTVFRNPAPTSAPVAATTTTRTAGAATAAPYVPSSGPEPTVFRNAARQKVATVTAPAIAPRKSQSAATPKGVTCPNASAFSQQFINKGARCGPQDEAPVTITNSSAKTSSVSLPPETVVVPRRVYESRQNTANVSVPRGYRTVWKDDRLNPHRAEHTLRPSQIASTAKIPAGYRRVDRGDDRYNRDRATASASGDAQTDLIWTRTVPRQLIRVPVQAMVVQVPHTVMASPAEAVAPVLVRLSSRSAPGSGGIGGMVRVRTRDATLR